MEIRKPRNKNQKHAHQPPNRPRILIHLPRIERVEGVPQDRTPRGFERGARGPGGHVQYAFGFALGLLSFGGV